MVARPCPVCRDRVAAHGLRTRTGPSRWVRVCSACAGELHRIAPDHFQVLPIHLTHNPTQPTTTEN